MEEKNILKEIVIKKGEKKERQETKVISNERQTGNRIEAKD